MRSVLGLLLFSIFITGNSDEIRHPRGSINPDVRQDNLMETVCKPGWSDSIRPKSSYTNKLKSKQLGGVGLKEFEEDHFIPLSLGGGKSDIDNLWPQRWEGKCGAKEKDKEEVRIHRRLCRGEITLKEAQDYFFNWWCE